MAKAIGRVALGLMMQEGHCETAFAEINQNFWHLRKLTVYSESELCSYFLRIVQNYCSVPPRKLLVSSICNISKGLFVAAQNAVTQTSQVFFPKGKLKQVFWTTLLVLAQGNIGARIHDARFAVLSVNINANVSVRQPCICVDLRWWIQ